MSWRDWLVVCLNLTSSGADCDSDGRRRRSSSLLLENERDLCMCKAAFITVHE